MVGSMRMVARWLLLVAVVVLSVLVVGAGPALAAHGGEVPTYGEGEDCVLVNFAYTDGHTDHFYACGDLFKNDLARDTFPDGAMHVAQLHVSCSQVWEDDPDDGIDGGTFDDPEDSMAHGEEHFVERYRIVQYSDFGTAEEEVKKECDEEFVPPTVDVCVELVNDASGDGTYTDDETADAEGEDVPEQVTVTNCGDAPHEIDDITIDGEAVCPDLFGMVQQPGESVTCDLVQPEHTPAEGVTETDTVTVTVHHPDDETVTATADDPTAMTTVVPPTVDVCVDLVNDASADGTYSDDEVAGAAGLDVPERVTVTNCGDEPHVIDEVTIGSPGDTPVDVCPNLIGMELAVGESVTCDVVRPDHTPEVNETRTDEVTVLVHHPEDASVTATDTDPTAMSVVDDSLVGAGDEEPDAEPAQDPGPDVEADELAATGPRAELGLAGLTSLTLGLLLLLGATAIVRQVRYARDDVRRAIGGS